MIQKDIGSSKLKDISPEKIIRNEDNPRLYFRSEELASLMASIKRYGVQVPITVYQDGDIYVLIDGERRWRCADKLNLKKIPALILPKPSPLDNLLLMFNIHALREQWDYLTIANKLPVVIDRFRNERGKEPNEIELSEATGLTRSQIRRCRLLLDLPPKYTSLLLQELNLPKQKQKLSEDFFIEMEKSLKTVQTRIPLAIKNIDTVRDALIEKFRSGVIGNITDFRKLSKIATSINNLGVKEEQARRAVQDIFSTKNKLSINDVYSEHYELLYDEKRVTQNVESISDFLEGVLNSGESSTLDAELIARLERLHSLIEKVLEEDR